ncbi:MAG TPA: CBS domain-containing protein [Gemmatimonadales bacterium]
MTWSLRIARIAGTDVKVHVTFLLLLGFFWFSGGPAAGLLLLALFGCVLLHEFGHIGMAARFGVRTPDVILLPIGGLARLERMPEEPKQELLIAIAGPAVTLVIAAVFYAWLAVNGTPPPLLPSLRVDPGGFIETLYRINVLLLLFNLLPAFPLDGGRVLRAILSARLGLVRGTRIAASVGQMLAFVIGFYAIMNGELLLLLIAFFIFTGAGGEATAVETRIAGRGLAVRDMMVTDFRTLPIYATLADAAELLVAGEQREFPVVDNLGGVEGLLTRDDLVRGLAARGAGGMARDAMSSGLVHLAPDLTFDEAVQRLRASRLPALPVVDGGRLIGLVTLDNITDLLLIRRAVGKS